MIYYFDFATGKVEGMQRWERRLNEMAEIFASKNAIEQILREKNPVIYEVYEFQEVPDKIGQLFWSTTVLYPGTVGGEYYMTKGHYHCDPACAEIYLVISGEGLLLLKGNNGAEALSVHKGTVAYIPPSCAHRMVNTGNDPLIFLAVYPAHAGHDYERVKKKGFGIRVFKSESGPVVRRDF